MSKQNLIFNDYATCLQGNKISVTFAMVRDDSVPHGYANQYRFRYQYCRIYCDVGNNDDYAYYDNSTWTTLSAWTPVEFSFEPGITDINRSIDITPPHLDFDAVFRLEVQVYEDSRNAYYGSTQGSYTSPFIAFYNRTASLQLMHAVHVNDKEIELEGTIADTGLFHPANHNEENIENSAAWQKYCQELWNCFFDASNAEASFIELSGAASLSSSMSNKTNQIIDTFTYANIYKWHTGTFKYTISVEDPMFKDLSIQANIYIQLSFKYNAYTSENTTFKLASDDTDGIYKTNIVLLPAPIASFQIKRRAIKAQMLEDDTAIETYSTGSGMFNHGSDVGVQPKQNSVVFAKEWESSFGWWGISETHKKLDWYLIGVVNSSSNSYEDKGEMTIQMIDAVSMSFYNADYFDCQINIDNVIAGFYTPISATLKVIQSKDDPSYYYGESGDIKIEIHETLVDGPLIRNIAIYIRDESKELLASQRAYSKISINAYALASPKINPGLGHSIALYDTHVKDGAIEPSNEPSIGFMNHEHAELASLKYSGGQLVSSVPITWNGIQPGGGGSDLPLNTIVLHTSNAVTGESGAKTQIKITGNLVIETTQH